MDYFDKRRQLGQHIVEMRKAQRISQKQLALMSDINKGYLSEIENGISNISVNKLFRIADALGVPLVPDLLLRQHPTRHQVGLSEAERVANLKSAFLSLPEVRGKRILLVDDTYTTGTTLRRAALALLDPHAGAAAVDVAVVARTPREKHDFQYNWSSPHESLPKNS